jgi:hypothetical protein
MDQVSIKYAKSSIARPSKIYPNLDFWFENKPSGNPASECILQICKNHEKNSLTIVSKKEPFFKAKRFKSSWDSGVPAISISSFSDKTKKFGKLNNFLFLSVFHFIFVNTKVNYFKKLLQRGGILL